MTTADIQKAICSIADKYPIRRVTLFGSRANGTHRPDSDIDLIIEFSVPITILTISRLTCDLEQILKLPVDVIHGPLRPDDIIEVQNEVLLYAA